MMHRTSRATGLARAALACALALPIAAQAADGVGWRGDGRGDFPATSLPASVPRIVWRVPLASWGNGSPVVGAGLVCVTSEPTTLACYDQATGARAWQSTNDVADALGAADAPEVRRR